MAMLDFLMVSDYLKTTITNSFKKYDFVFLEVKVINDDMTYRSYDFIFKNYKNIAITVTFQPKSVDGTVKNLVFFSVSKFNERIYVYSHLNNEVNFLGITTPEGSSFEKLKEKVQENTHYLNTNMASIISGDSWPRDLVDNNDLENYR